MKPESYSVKDVRQFLNGLAEDIRKMKGTRKEHSNGYVPGLNQARRTFRTYHVAQSLARGRNWEQIEKVTESNKPDVDRILEVAQKIKAQRKADQEAWEKRQSEKVEAA